MAKVGQNARAIIQFEFDIDLLEGKPFKTVRATMRLCFSDTLTYQKRSKKGKMETRARGTRAGDREKKREEKGQKTDKKWRRIDDARPCPSGMPFGHAFGMPKT